MIENIDDVDGPMSSTSIHGAVVSVTCEERTEGHVQLCASRRNLPNLTGGVSGNAATKAE